MEESRDQKKHNNSTGLECQIAVGQTLFEEKQVQVVGTSAQDIIERNEWRIRLYTKELGNKINEPQMKPPKQEKLELKGIIGVPVLMQISWKFYCCQTI